MLGLITYCCLLIALAIGAWIRPSIGVAAVLCLYGLKQWGQSSTLLLAQYRQFTNYAVFAIALIALFRAASKRRCFICCTPTTTWLIVALLVYALISLVWAPDIEKSFEQWVIQGPYIITIALLAPLLLTDSRDGAIGFFWTMIVGGAICVLALFFGKWGNRGLLLFGDLYEQETNPLALSSLAGTVFIICALSLGQSKQMLLRLLAIGLIPITLAVILKSGSRGQLIAAAVGVVLSLPIALRMKDAKSIAAMVLVGALIAGLGSWGASLVSIDSARWQGNDPQNAVTGRFENARRLIEVSTSHGFTTMFGLGNSSSFQVIGGYPHITGLEVLGEEGIVGALLYMSIIVLAVRSIWRISTRGDAGGVNRNVLALLTGLFAFELILSWKQGTLLSSVYVFFYAIVLGRLEVGVSSKSPVRVDPPEPLISLVRFENLLR